MVAHSVRFIEKNHVKPSFFPNINREPSALSTRLCTKVYMVQWRVIFIYGPVPIGDPGKGFLVRGTLHIKTLIRVQSTVDYKSEKRKHKVWPFWWAESKALVNLWLQAPKMTVYTFIIICLHVIWRTHYWITHWLLHYSDTLIWTIHLSYG